MDNNAIFCQRVIPQFIWRFFLYGCINVAKMFKPKILMNTKFMKSNISKLILLWSSKIGDNQLEKFKKRVIIIFVF